MCIRPIFFRCYIFLKNTMSLRFYVTKCNTKMLLRLAFTLFKYVISRTVKLPFIILAHISPVCDAYTNVLPCYSHSCKLTVRCTTRNPYCNTVRIIILCLWFVFLQMQIIYEKVYLFSSICNFTFFK
jgi:hypothetical protein